MQITDVTGIPTNLTGRYDSAGFCINFVLDPIPDVCLPFNATIPATNASSSERSFPIQGRALILQSHEMIIMLF